MAISRPGDSFFRIDRHVGPGPPRDDKTGIDSGEKRKARSGLLDWNEAIVHGGVFSLTEATRHLAPKVEMVYFLYHVLI